LARCCRLPPWFGGLAPGWEITAPWWFYFMRAGSCEQCRTSSPCGQQVDEDLLLARAVGRARQLTRAGRKWVPLLRVCVAGSIGCAFTQAPPISRFGEARTTPFTFTFSLGPLTRSVLVITALFSFLNRR
jgi:hypothetical protein